MSHIAIIGSGLGGLTAGCLLAQKGHKVTIFESHVMPGGYTAGFWRNGFYFESGTLSFESSAQIFPAMKKLGVYDRIPFVRQRLRFLAPEYDFIPEDYDQFKQAMSAAFPSEKNNLSRYFAAVDPMVKAIQKLMGGGPSALSGGLGMALQYVKHRRTTITDFTARYFDRGSTLFRILKGFGYPDMGVWILGGALVSFLEDYWAVKGGMQLWADVLADQFQSWGGELKLNTPVEKIITKNGAVVGVEADGRVHDADWVISACDYKKTFLNLLDDRSLVPPPIQDKIKNNAVSEGVVTVYLGLRASNDELRAWMKSPHVMVFDEQEDADIKNPNDARFFEKKSIGLYSPSLHDSRLSPADKSSLMIQSTAPYHWMDNWGGGDRDKYRLLKEQVKRTLIAKAGKVIPDLEHKIDFEDAATPLTYERYTGNSDGATSAWSWNPNNRFFSSMMKIHVETPVKRLLIGSCWSNQIGGVPGALGAAQKCAKRIS